MIKANLTNETPINNILAQFAIIWGVSMKGKIIPRGVCPECGGPWQFYKNRNDEGYNCPDHPFVKPERFRIDARAFGFGFLYSNKRNDVLETYGQAVEVFIELNTAAKNATHSGQKLKADEWVPAKIKECRFENITDRWLINYDEEVKSRAKSKSRLNNIKKALNHLNPYFKGKDIREIGRDDIERFYHSLLKKNLSKKYIKDILDTLKALLKRYTGTIPEFPVFTVIPAKEKQRLGLDREILIVDRIPEKYRLQILLLIRTGMRINEVCAIKVKDMVDGIIYVDKAISDGELRLSRKSGKVVDYRVTQELWKDLLKHIEDKDHDDYVFSCQNPRRLYKAWVKACSDARTKPINLQHASRHSTATEIMRRYEKEALQEISARLGNNKQTVQEHYIVSEPCLSQDDGEKTI